MFCGTPQDIVMFCGTPQDMVDVIVELELNNNSQGKNQKYLERNFSCVWMNWLINFPVGHTGASASVFYSVLTPNEGLSLPYSIHYPSFDIDLHSAAHSSLHLKHQRIYLCHHFHPELKTKKFTYIGAFHIKQQLK
jgi:hypothetical protein